MSDLLELHEEPEAEREPKKKRGLMWLLLLFGLILILSSATIILTSMFVPPVENATKDLDGNWVVPEDDTGWNDPDAIAAIDAVDEIPTGGRFIVPSVGLDAALGEANSYKGVINPPGFKSVYRIRDMGVSLDKAAEGTVYVATHSLRHGGRGPGNYLFDVDTGQITVKIGDEMIADGVKYHVVDFRSIPKADLGSQSDIWENSPGRLVVITCLQRPDNSASRNNVVIIGQLDGTDSTTSGGTEE
ncbi:MAG: class F sortase [Propionibacteriaceae bacterium]|jgi:hypothetical protein|nr:class F sortase [Propionibacteriaceae bacterium]